MKKDSKTKIDISLGAKASLEVSTEIPAQSTGRFVDAITDIIRPFTEKRGLRADQIRLQREDVLMEIAHKAIRRLEIGKQIPQPLPNKFLVPFLEKASLEEEGSLLIERWVDLLANCSTDPKLAHPRFVQILSELTAEDAQLLRSIAFNSLDKKEHPRIDFYDCVFNYEPKYLKITLKNLLKELEELNNYIDLEIIYKLTVKFFQNPGIAILSIGIDDIDEDSITIGPLDTDEDRKALFLWDVKYSDRLNILQSLSLVDDHEIDTPYKAWHINVRYVCLTSLGIEFLTKCDNDLNTELKRNSPDTN